MGMPALQDGREKVVSGLKARNTVGTERLRRGRGVWEEAGRVGGERPAGKGVPALQQRPEQEASSCRTDVVAGAGGRSRRLRQHATEATEADGVEAAADDV